MLEKNNCSKCKYYRKLDESCGLCTFYNIHDRVHFDNPLCKHSILNQEVTPCQATHK
jgi:hypothetical protein